VRNPAVSLAGWALRPTTLVRGAEYSEAHRAGKRVRRHSPTSLQSSGGTCPCAGPERRPAVIEGLS